MDFSKRLNDCLDAAGSASREVDIIPKTDNINDGERLHWLQTQLTNVMTELAAMIADIESGLSIQSMGFSVDGDLEELVEGFEIEISSLKGQIQSLLHSRFVISK
jgi:hypothetical protein